MTHKEPIIYIKHIHDCIEKILNYTKNETRESFQKNELIQDEIIGEATKLIPSEFRDKYSNIEWKKIAGMRDKLIHGYIGVDILSVWRVVADILPQLKNDIEYIFNNES